MEQVQSQWFAVYTKPRQERLAREHLQRQGFHCFLPEALNPYQRLSRKCLPRIEPLFPRYLFLKAEPDTQDLAVVRSTRGVVGLVRSGHHLLRVPRRVIRAIRARRDAESGLVTLDPIAARPGDRVRVFDGPFAGIEGLLESTSGEHRAMILMDMLGTQARVEVDRLLIQRAG